MSIPNDREHVLAALRTALQDLPERIARPEYPKTLSLSRLVDRPESTPELLRRTVAAVNGEVLSGWSSLADYLRGKDCRLGYCDPVLWESFKPHCPADLEVETVFQRERLDDYQFGITAADGAIAETGTVILTDGGTSSRLGALAPWVHVAVLDPANLFRTLPEAVERLGSDRNTIWVTGPSKTADVEGILIEGVHGPCHQAILLTGEG